MGLAAGQARLLTITGRKSDCEFESMRLSHQKLALARELADLSNQYQDSLDKTKLVYDYYGTGDTTTPLSYGILMSPSILNDYLPVLLTDSMGRAVLDSKYAAAAKAAGIPQEGLGTLPSETIRNAFVEELYGQGIISEYLKNTIQSIPYNQCAGVGGGTSVAVTTESGNIDEFIEYLFKNGSSYTMDPNSFPEQERTNGFDDSDTSRVALLKIDTNKYDLGYDDGYKRDGIRDTDRTSSGSFDTEFDGRDKKAQFNLAQLLSGKEDPTDDTSRSFQYYLGYNGIRGEQSPVFGVALMQDIINGEFMDWLDSELSEFLDLGDSYTSHALEYAREMTYQLLNKDDVYLNGSAGSVTAHDYYRYPVNYDDDDIEENTEGTDAEVKAFLDPITNKLFGDTSYDEYYQQGVVYRAKDYIGFTAIMSEDGGSWFKRDRDDHTTGGISINNIAKAYLTYFADFMNGVSKTDINGIEEFDVKIGETKNVNLCTDNHVFEYTWKIGSEVSSDDLGQATFYDALFNQLCLKGWVENDNVRDNDYMQKMLENGMMYISKIKDDGYYYQGNYATDNYIKVIADERFIAAAEAKYNTEKAKLNAKEQTLDLKMKNLDTEISALTTEYDTVKNTIAKNIEKSFKRYSA